MPLDNRLADTCDALGLRFILRHLRLTVHELLILLRHLRGRARAARLRDKTELKLNIGCGPNVKTGWINIDLHKRADLSLDIRKRLPFEDSSCALVYSEHFLEHLDYPDDAAFFLKECFRVLMPGGLISTGVPNAEARLCLYVNDNPAGRRRIQRMSWHPPWVETHMEQVNFLFRQNYQYSQHQHRFAYDLVTLEKCLQTAGFAHVRQRSPDLSLDSPTRASSTLYVDATKPA